jgi:5-methylcytosine-specific restriction enzyme A
MSGDFKRLIRGLIREAIIASSPKPKSAKKIKQKARITQKNSRYIPKATRVDVLRRDNYRCVFCGVSAKKAELQIDHIIPFSQGGSNTIGNLQTLCSDCNLGKSNRFSG